MDRMQGISEDAPPLAQVEEVVCAALVAAVSLWARESARRFVWRVSEEPYTPFQFLILEVLLIRTPAPAVDKVIDRIRARAKDPEELGQMGTDELLGLLRPLGLANKRARALIAISSSLQGAAHGGEIPRTRAELMSLPYVGEYVADAVRCFAFGEAVVVVDANVRRVLSRVFGKDQWLERPGVTREAREYCARIAEVAIRNGADFRLINWGLIDVGALFCTPQRPRCAECPFSTFCRSSTTRDAGRNE